MEKNRGLILHPGDCKNINQNQTTANTHCKQIFELFSLKNVVDLDQYLRVMLVSITRKTDTIGMS